MGAEEYLKSTGNPRTTPTLPKQEDDGELEHVVVADDDRVSAAAKRGAPTSWSAQYSLNKLASFSL